MPEGGSIVGNRMVSSKKNCDNESKADFGARKTGWEDVKRGQRRRHV